MLRSLAPFATALFFAFLAPPLPAQQGGAGADWVHFVLAALTAATTFAFSALRRIRAFLFAAARA